jgi:Ser/Thr protein kinase RdoA (MazF antagonist)
MTPRGKTMQLPPSILQAYPVTVTRTAALGSAGGFSGAVFWRLETPTGPLCLRRWPPEHPSPERLQFIHDVLRHVHLRGVAEVPVPLPTRDGSSFVRHGDCLWELAPWMPGTADYHRRPTRQRLAAAMRLLARFHQATASYAQEPKPHQPSPGLGQRLELLDRLLAGEAQRIASAARRDASPARSSRAEQLLEAFLELAPRCRPALLDAVHVKVTLQPCLRDIWHDHVLFSGDQTTGLIDFGALREECVAGDVARLLASLVCGDRAAWQSGLAAYRETRTLDGNEICLLGVFHETTTLLSGINWLRWIYLQNRTFDEPDRVLERIDENLEQLGRMRDQNRVFVVGSGES